MSEYQIQPKSLRLDRIRNRFEALPGCEDLAKGNPPGSKNPGSAKKGIPFST
jgi:hypothetical protein